MGKAMRGGIYMGKAYKEGYVRRYMGGVCKEVYVGEVYMDGTVCGQVYEEWYVGKYIQYKCIQEVSVGNRRCIWKEYGERLCERCTGEVCV